MKSLFKHQDGLTIRVSPRFDGYDRDGQIGFTFVFSVLPKNGDKIEDVEKLSLEAVFRCKGGTGMPSESDLPSETNLFVTDVSGENKIVSETDPTGSIISSIGELSTPFTWSTPVSPVAVGLTFIGSLLSRNKTREVQQGSYADYGHLDLVAGRFIKRAGEVESIVGEHTFSVRLTTSNQVSAIVLQRLSVKTNDTEVDLPTEQQLRPRVWHLEEWKSLRSEGNDGDGPPHVVIANSELSGPGSVMVCSSGSYASKHPERGNAHPLPGESGFVVGKVLEQIPSHDGKWKGKRRFGKGHYTLLLCPAEDEVSVRQVSIS